MPKEVELKLRCVEPVSWERLLSAAAIIGVEPVGESQEKQLVNTYYDTRALDLNKRKVALRIRAKDNRHIQTLKTAGASIEGVHQRGEWEWDLSENRLDHDLLAATEAWPSDLLGLELLAVFNTDFTRISQDVEFKHLLFELVLDQGKITTGNSESFELIEEIEVEFKPKRAGAHNARNTNARNTTARNTTARTCGSSANKDADAISESIPSFETIVLVMRELAEQLTKALPLALDDRSKAERGYKLFEAVSG